ncbi:hypothetical protein N657DRAFT_679260 [Parathielavia appendiculata]|uniref:Uncharacterized protein n=1 Tax=Parathielavia appendiculata TaxID=2587402 RepID=A0AAN6U4U9_9PEZI|nr:hypothetical protein N657DRAFT_679260 [Parathielavia appendiculata]
MPAQPPTTYLGVQRDDITITTPSTTPLIISRIPTPTNPSNLIPCFSLDSEPQRGRKRLRVEDILHTAATTTKPSSSPSKATRPRTVGNRKSTDSSLETFRGRPRYRSTSFPATPSTNASTPLSRALSLSLSRRGTPTESGSSERGQHQHQPQPQPQPQPGTVRFLRVVQIERGRARERGRRGSPTASPVLTAAAVAAVSPRRVIKRRERRRRSQSPSRSRSPVPVGSAAFALGEKLLAGLEWNEGGQGMCRRRRQRTRTRGREHGVGLGAGMVVGVDVRDDVQAGCGSGGNEGGGGSVSSAVDGAAGE